MSLSDVTRGTFSNSLSMRRRPGGAVRLLACVDPGNSFKPMAAVIAFRRLWPLQPNPGNSRPPRADRKGVPNAGRIPVFSGPARRTAWRRPPAMPGQDAKRRLAGQGTAAGETDWQGRTTPGTAPSADPGAAPASCRRRFGRGCALSQVRHGNRLHPWQAVARRLPLTLLRPPSGWQPPRRFTPPASHRRTTMHYQPRASP